MHEVNYCRRPEDVIVFDGVVHALIRLREAGFLRVIVTNQSGIGRGMFLVEDFERVQEELLRQLRGEIDATYFCPDAPDDPSPRRKPSPGMLLEAAADLGIDLERSFMIGDKNADLQCARAAGVTPILVKTGYGNRADEVLADSVASGVPDAVDWILAQVANQP